MSVLASGTVEMDLKGHLPKELVDAANETFRTISINGTMCYIEFDGNWWLEDVIDTIEPFNPYVKSGHISYWSDEGDGFAVFKNGKWEEEWEQSYYESELPTSDLSATPRVAKILNTVAESLMSGSDSEQAIRVLFRDCKLTDEEIELYNLKWLRDLT